MNSTSFRYGLWSIAVLLLLSGCGGTALGGQDGQETKDDRVKITIMANLHTPVVPSKTVQYLVEEYTGSKLDIKWTPDGSYEEKFNASMATGALPEAVYLKNADTLNMLRDPIRNGLFWEIGPLLPEYPNLKRLQTEVLKNTSVDGKIYGLYQERPLSRQGIIYQKSWAERLNLEAPTTIEELYNMLYQFTYNDPDGNGKQDTIGLTDRSDLVYGAFKTVAAYFGTPNGWGEQDGKLLPEFMFPEYMDTMNFFKKLHQEGLINQDFPVTAKADQQELLITGKAGVYIGSMGDVHSLQLKAEAVNPNAVFDVQNRIAGPKGERIWASTGFGTIVLFPKTSVQSEDELRDVLTFFDKLMDPEMVNLLRWGVEDVHYTIENGKAVPSSNLDLTFRDVKPYQGIEIGGPSTIPGYLESDFQMPAKEKSDDLTRDNDSILVHDPTSSLESNTFNERSIRLQDFIQDATYHYILGTIDEAGFQSVVDRWLTEGGKQIIEEFNKAQ
ncbi:extracellular solute-binding protein [Cohnella sp.]|uniref:extracellular solute-binding protein n=1 Tax=Cohnella sp. TaxID=1883426 RepID=UPI003568E73D